MKLFEIDKETLDHIKYLKQKEKDFEFEQELNIWFENVGIKIIIDKIMQNNIKNKKRLEIFEKEFKNRLNYYFQRNN